MFIGRETELKFLNDKYNSDGGQLVVLYGRRRVGKTETLREFCKEKPHVFFSCTQTTDRVQLQKFSKQILKENIPAKNYITEFADWEKDTAFPTELMPSCIGDKTVKKIFLTGVKTPPAKTLIPASNPHTTIKIANRWFELNFFFCNFIRLSSFIIYRFKYDCIPKIT